MKQKVFLFRWRKLGSHYHTKVFSAQSPSHTFANLGELTLDSDDWMALRQILGWPMEQPGYWNNVRFEEDAL